MISRLVFGFSTSPLILVFGAASASAARRGRKCDWRLRPAYDDLQDRIVPSGGPSVAKLDAEANAYVAQIKAAQAGAATAAGEIIVNQQTIAAVQAELAKGGLTRAQQRADQHIITVDQGKDRKLASTEKKDDATANQYEEKLVKVDGKLAGDGQPVVPSPPPPAPPPPPPPPPTTPITPLGEELAPYLGTFVTDVNPAHPVTPEDGLLQVASSIMTQVSSKGGNTLNQADLISGTANSDGSTSLSVKIYDVKDNIWFIVQITLNPANSAADTFSVSNPTTLLSPATTTAVATALTAATTGDPVSASQIASIVPTLVSQLNLESPVGVDSSTYTAQASVSGSVTKVALKVSNLVDWLNYEVFFGPPTSSNPSGVTDLELAPTLIPNPP
jgi:hypothetical protein